MYWYMNTSAFLRLACVAKLLWFAVSWEPTALHAHPNRRHRHNLSLSDQLRKDADKTRPESHANKDQTDGSMGLRRDGGGGKNADNKSALAPFPQKHGFVLSAKYQHLERLLAGEEWEQSGQTIVGEASGDRSGWSVAMSENATVVAIGSPWNADSTGQVRVYERNMATGVWKQLGDDIHGEKIGDESGYSVSMSSDGSRLAIGARLNSGNGVESGHVRVYKWDKSGNWVQEGSDIDGEAQYDHSGTSVAMSSAGDRVVIGAERNDGNGTRSGNARVYQLLFQNSLAIWTQLGDDIDGENAGDFAGHAVAMSGDGGRVVVGSHHHNGAKFTLSGHVRVFELKTLTWFQLGQDLDGEAALDRSGYSVSMNYNGTRVAIGAALNDGNGKNSGHVRVYELQSDSTWAQLGDDIDGMLESDHSGWSVALSDSGDRVAVGARFAGIGDNGEARVYELKTFLNLTFWQQLGQVIEGQSALDYGGTSVSISGDGTAVALGAPNRACCSAEVPPTLYRRGDVRVFSLLTNSPPELTVDQVAVSVIRGDLATNTGTCSDADDDAIGVLVSVGQIAQTTSATGISWSWEHGTTNSSNQTTVTVTCFDQPDPITAILVDQKTFELIVNEPPDPSRTPSEAPSNSPTKSLPPSEVPSSKPSISFAPSIAPTRVPSEGPSNFPTKSLPPSEVPSTKPSISFAPSSTPTRVPSEVPSSAPTKSLPPSEAGTSPPSRSDAPSSSPSAVPSAVPSSAPSAKPSSIPSSVPSAVPSSVPSGKPSSMPSNFPSAIPSSQPSSSEAPSAPPTPFGQFPNPPNPNQQTNSTKQCGRVKSKGRIISPEGSYAELLDSTKKEKVTFVVKARYRKDKQTDEIIPIGRTKVTFKSGKTKIFKFKSEEIYDLLEVNATTAEVAGSGNMTVTSKKGKPETTHQFRAWVTEEGKGTSETFRIMIYHVESTAAIYDSGYQTVRGGKNSFVDLDEDYKCELQGQRALESLNLTEDQLDISVQAKSMSLNL